MDANITTAILQNHLRFSPKFMKSLNDEDFSNYLRISKENLGNAQEAFNGKKLITVVGPNGGYDVGIRESPEAVILEKGWAEFSLAHHLCSTDKLVFICGCHNLFFVLIYNKQGKLLGNHFSSLNTEGGDTESKPDIRYDEKAQFKCKREKVAASSSRLSGTKKKISATSGSSDSSSDSQPTNEVKLEKTFISHRRAVNDVEVEKALKAAKSFQSSRPLSFHIQMKRNNVNREFYIYVPTKFARENLPKKATKLSLRVPGKTNKWHVSCTFKVQNKEQHVWTITGGWAQFILDNNVEINDTLVFEMRKAPTQRRNNKIKMNVHIFRVVNEITPLQVI